jgi:preprotein translocase subunit SecY
MTDKDVTNIFWFLAIILIIYFVMVTIIIPWINKKFK